MEKAVSNKGHKVRSVVPGSIAFEMGVESGDILYKINGHDIRDVFDYDYYVRDGYIEVLMEDGNGEEYILEIEKDEEEDIGLEFYSYLLDDYRSCHNKCIFCFIDQMPSGMRDTLYFKDDDSRLSFLQGNYVTLTNLKDDDLQRICDFHMEPINISIHTTDPDLRNMMLGNRFAGESLKKIDVLKEAGIEMNGQIVLCRNINDKENLDRTIGDIMKWRPQMKSLSVVPAGLTKYRDGLYPLEPFNEKECVDVIRQVEKWQEKSLEEYGDRFVFASDEWYIKGGIPFPSASEYEDYPQFENGVGMMRNMMQEVEEYTGSLDPSSGPGKDICVSSVCGTSPYPFIRECADMVSAKFPEVHIKVIPVENEFFGSTINVTGLLTGGDIIRALKETVRTEGQDVLGSALIIPSSALRFGEDVFLDDISIKDVEKELSVKVIISGNSGKDFVDSYICAENIS